MPSLYPFTEHEEKCIRSEQRETVLHYAAKRGYNNVLLKLLQAGANINETEKHGNTALHLALQKKHVVTAAILISNHADLNIPNNDKESPIHYGVQTGSYALVTKLLQRGANVNAKNKNSDSALHLALKTQQLDISKLLLSNYGVLHTPNNNNETGLHYAALHGYSDIVRMILKSSISNIDLQDQSGNTALHYAIIKGNLNVATILLDYNASCALSNNNGRTALHYSSKHNFIKIIYHQLSNSCHIDKQDKDGNTALHLAVRFKHNRLAKILLNNGASSNIKNDKNLTAFDYAFQENCREIINIIKVNNIDHQNQDGHTLLHLAIANFRDDIVSELLCSHANYTIRSNQDESVLHIAVKTDQYKWVKVFVRFGVDVSCQDVKGNTALHLALIHGHHEIAKFLMSCASADAEVDLVNELGNSILHYIAIQGYKDLLTKVLSKIPSVNVQNLNGETPLHLALLHHHFSIAKTLIMYNADVGIRDCTGRSAESVIRGSNNRSLLEIIHR